MENSTMKAAVCTAYGPPSVMRINNVPKPIPKDDEMLITVMASTVNSGDVRVRGLDVNGFMLFVMRCVLGFTRPRKPILGVVYAGTVAQVGKNVSAFATGDAVFGITGFKFGAHAEFLVTSNKGVVVKMPKNASFEEAAAICFGGQTAVHFLKKAGIEKRNLNVLIYGATGSVGTAAVQIAKYYDANVTAVCSQAGKGLAQSVGADRVIRYDNQDFTKVEDRYDIVLDAVGKTTKKQCAHLLTERGVYKTVGGMEVAPERVYQLELLKEMFEKGAFKATIDRTFALDEIVEAHTYVTNGRKKGNVVLQISA